MESELERHLRKHCERLNFEERKKAHLLNLDLTSIAKKASPPSYPKLPEIRDLASALGCLYVLEGATLGGQIIYRHFKNHFGLNSERGLKFYSGYGQETGQMWKSFREFAIFCSESEEQPLFDGQVIQSAISTFTLYEEWLCPEPRGF